MTISPRWSAVLAVLAGVPAMVAGAHAQAVEYTSPAGVAYRSLADTGAIARAEQALAADPHNAQAIMRLGMAQVAAEQDREAIATFTRGIKQAPNDVAFYRERGHRYLSLREFGKAMDDLTHGVALEIRDVSKNYSVIMRLVELSGRGDVPTFVDCDFVVPEFSVDRVLADAGAPAVLGLLEL